VPAALDAKTRQALGRQTQRVSHGRAQQNAN